MLEEAEDIGRRVKRARLRLGMPQADLAAALGKSQPWVSRIEAGTLELDSSSLISRIAAALHVHPNDLIDRPYDSGPAENQWQIAARSVLRELRRYDLAPEFPGTPRPSSVLWGEVKKIHRLRNAAAHTAIIQTLPDLLRESRALAEVSTGREREEAFAVYAVLAKSAHSNARTLGYPELVAVASERTVWAARLSGDPVMPAIANYVRMWDMWDTADWDDSIALAERSLNLIEEHMERGEPLAMRAYGGLQLRAAVAAARADRKDEARDRVQNAREVADRMNTYEGPEVFDRHSLTFTSGNVTIHGVAIEVESRDHVRAIELNDEADPQEIATLPKSRRGHHHMDLARALVWNGQRDRGLEELEHAERIAPELVRNHPMARSALRQIVYAERAGVRERLRRMSDRFHLDG
ncbi:helix-turn-helix domain-containing protein [Streptomyces sp. NPDC000405]|uniref:helix-turn-helix domain-containing protein n=1 Tax=Streptomyces sp. NPDC000405 TaxID=3161033 RepID=UPI00398D5389